MTEIYFLSPNMCKVIMGKRYLDFFFFSHYDLRQQNTHQTVEGRGDISAVNMKSSPPVQREIKNLVKNYTSPLRCVFKAQGRGPALGACGGRITLKEIEIPSHLQKSGFFLFVSDS